MADVVEDERDDMLVDDVKEKVLRKEIVRLRVELNVQKKFYESLYIRDVGFLKGEIEITERANQYQAREIERLTRMEDEMKISGMDPNKERPKLEKKPNPSRESFYSPSTAKENFLKHVHGSILSVDRHESAGNKGDILSLKMRLEEIVRNRRSVGTDTKMECGERGKEHALVSPGIVEIGNRQVTDTPDIATDVSISTTLNTPPGLDRAIRIAKKEISVGRERVSICKDGENNEIAMDTIEVFPNSSESFADTTWIDDSHATTSPLLLSELSADVPDDTREKLRNEVEVVSILRTELEEREMSVFEYRARQDRIYRNELVLCDEAVRQMRIERDRSQERHESASTVGKERDENVVPGSGEHAVEAESHASLRSEFESALKSEQDFRSSEASLRVELAVSDEHIARLSSNLLTSEHERELLHHELSESKRTSKMLSENAMRTLEHEENAMRTLEHEEIAAIRARQSLETSNLAVAKLEDESSRREENIHQNARDAEEVRRRSVEVSRQRCRDEVDAFKKQSTSKIAALDARIAYHEVLAGKFKSELSVERGERERAMRTILGDCDALRARLRTNEVSLATITKRSDELKRTLACCRKEYDEERSSSKRLERFETLRSVENELVVARSALEKARYEHGSEIASIRVKTRAEIDEHLGASKVRLLEAESAFHAKISTEMLEWQVKRAKLEQTVVTYSEQAESNARTFRLRMKYVEEAQKRREVAEFDTIERLEMAAAERLARSDDEIGELRNNMGRLTEATLESEREAKLRAAALLRELERLRTASEREVTSVRRASDSSKDVAEALRREIEETKGSEANTAGLNERLVAVEMHCASEVSNLATVNASLGETNARLRRELKTRVVGRTCGDWLRISSRLYGIFAVYAPLGMVLRSTHFSEKSLGSVLVNSVSPESDAGACGIRSGDYVYAIGSEVVGSQRSLSDVVSMLRQKTPYMLVLERPSYE
eukprot:g21.t1